MKPLAVVSAVIAVIALAIAGYLLVQNQQAGTLAVGTSLTSRTSTSGQPMRITVTLSDDSTMQVVFKPFYTETAQGSVLTALQYSSVSGAGAAKLAAALNGVSDGATLDQKMSELIDREATAASVQAMLNAATTQSGKILGNSMPAVVRAEMHTLASGSTVQAEQAADLYIPWIIFDWCFWNPLSMICWAY